MTTSSISSINLSIVKRIAMDDHFSCKIFKNSDFQTHTENQHSS